MLNEGGSMHPSEVVLAYCDESLSDIWKSRLHVSSEPTHILEDEMLA